MAQDATGEGEGGAAAALPVPTDAGTATATAEAAAAAQAAAEQAAIEQAAAAQAAADKATADKSAADKAAADKLAADRAAADTADAAARSKLAIQEDDNYQHPNLALAVAAAFLVATVAKLHLFQGSDAMLDRVDKLATGALLILTALWFIHCFTGDAKRRINDIFVFAYAFTLGSFAMLVLPFVSEQQAHTEVARPASLSLVRGCVRKNAAGGLSDVSAVVICPYENDKTLGWPDVPDLPASGPGPETVPGADGTPAAARMRPHRGELRYTLLLSIGGVTATVRDDPPARAVGAVAAAAGASRPDQHVEVMGGLAVPFFVLVMAFIGGAVSLSRRIPEYQRRLHPDYKPTAKEGVMLPFEARETVVFQIMQLVSAPFLAVATWYIITPAGLSSAATLAFGTGFASEPLLLMIRGLVEGIRPEGSRPKSSEEPAPPAPPGGGAGGGGGGQDGKPLTGVDVGVAADKLKAD